MSHKLSWDAARPMTKGLRATLIAVATFAMSAITPTHADTLTGCPPDNFGAPCSGAFFSQRRSVSFSRARSWHGSIYRRGWGPTGNPSFESFRCSP